MRQEEKDKLKKYGKLVCDFANAKTTDDILTSFFANVQSVFNFSSDFKEKVLKNYPTKKVTIDSISNEEQEPFKLLGKRNALLYSLNKYINPYYYDMKEYKPAGSIFMVAELEFSENGEPSERDFSMPVEDIEVFFNNIVDNEDMNDVRAKLKELTEICHQIEKTRTKTAYIRLKEIEKITNEYKRITELHDEIEAIQKKLKIILLQIIESENCYESNGFKSILSRYNLTQKTFYTITDDKKLIKVNVFTEDYFLKRNLLSSSYIDIFNAPISYCFIEYLKHSEYRGKERLTVCQKCNDIFIKSKFYDYQFFCPSCSRKNRMTPEERASYMRGYRANPIVKKRERKR